MSDRMSSPSRPTSPVGPLPDIATARPAYRFNWDASRRQGPGSISETTEGRGDYFNATPRVDIYGTASTSVVNAVPSQWSSSKHGFHAISTVVNNPHKRSDPPKAHAAVPSIPLADLPRVRRKDFDAYLKAIGPEWDRFQKSVELGREGAAQIGTASASSSALNPSSLDVDFSVPETPRTPRLTKALPPLTSIPQVFFDPKFNLGDPRTFNAVAETSSFTSHSLPFSDPTTPTTPYDPSALAHSLPLLEKLSHHADTLEQHLVHEIARRATPFFAALTNLQDLQAESSRCLARIQSLRSQLQDVDKHGAMRGLEAVRREARLGHLKRVREGVRFTGGVVEMVGLARNLVGAGQWGEALSVVEGLKMMWESTSHPSANGSQPPNGLLQPVLEEPPDNWESTSTASGTVPKSSAAVPLSQLKAFASLPSQLQVLTLEIAASLTTDVVGVLKVDLVQRVHGSRDPAQTSSHTELRDRLRPLVLGLVRTRSVREAMSEWRGIVLGEVKGVIKRHIPAFDLEDEDPKASRKGASDRPWVGDVRTMAHDVFLDLLRGVYTDFLGCIEGLQDLNGVFLEVLEATSQSDIPVDMATAQDALFDILSSSAENANLLASKALSARAEQHSKLELREFVELFNESWSFVVRCEVICRRMIVGLRGVVVGQAKSFLQTFHQSRISQSAKLVEDEQWSQADVPQSLQHIADVLVDAAVHDPHDFVLRIGPAVSVPRPSPLPRLSTLMPPYSPSSSRPSSPLSPRSSLPRPVSPRPVSPRPPPNGTSSSKPSKHVRIEERSYFAVSATQKALILLTDYLKVIVNLSLLTTDTMSRVIEFLKAFNSRTCQVVLGAGAMRSAGLKNITAKHLALASQSLSIMIALIPYVRETFRRHLNPKQAVMLVEFDKLKRDYQEHQNEIHAKLIAIMGDRLVAHIKTLQSVQWDVPPAKPGVNDYMELLVKETVTLHKVLSRYLSSSVVEYVMSQVFAANNHRLSEEYIKIDLPSLEAKERLLADARFLHSKLSSLKNVSAPTGMLETVVSEKRIVGQPTSPLPEMPSSRPTPTKRTSLFANERIKTMLSRSTEKALPTPIATVPMLPTTSESRPNSPLPPIVNGNGLAANGSAVEVSTPTPPEKAGFRQVAIVDATDVKTEQGEQATPPPIPAKDIPPSAQPAPVSNQEHASSESLETSKEPLVSAVLFAEPDSIEDEGVVSEQHGTTERL